MTLTITVRVIKSFEFRTTKSLVLKEIDPEMTVGELKVLIQSKLPITSGFKPYLNTPFDTLKLYFQPHGNKSQNLIINIDDIGFLDDNQTLAASGLENETEISYFVKEEYEKFKLNPEIKW
ncbi:hypothetical protein BC833DRAFT_579361 [Globomyces pollinis-pini]|nr:hypothetical protein BC833DRAFT_579361 [Globomyces pollinis-pini]